MNQFLCWPKNHPVHVTITWLNLKYHITWPSTIYRTPPVQLDPQPMCLVDWSEISWLCSIEVNLAIRWPLKCMSATLRLEGFTLMTAALPPGNMVGTRMSSHLRLNTPSPEKSCLEQSIMLFNSWDFGIWMLLFEWLVLCPKRTAPSQLTRGNGSSISGPNEHSPGSRLFPYPNFPQHPNPLSLVPDHQ